MCADLPSGAVRGIMNMAAAGHGTLRYYSKRWTLLATSLSIQVSSLTVLPLLANNEQEPEQPVTLLAETQRQVAKGHVIAEGYVAIQAQGVRLQADKVEFWEDEMRVVAEGNVVFESGDQKIVATHLEANLNTQTGRFYNAYGRAGEDLFFYGEIIEKESEEYYVIERGAFTSCTQPNPRWRFTASKARIRRDHHVRLYHTLFRIKSVPIFYLPIMHYPIDEDDRSTGFLFPQIGNSSNKGFLYSQGFFWAINRSMDATINVDHFAELGWGGGAEFRYTLSDTSRGEVRTWFLNQSVSGSREYSINGYLNQDLPGGFKASARADYFSSFDFQQRFQEDYNRAMQRSKRASATISNSWTKYNLRVVMDRNDTSFGDRVAVRQILPRVRFSSRQSRIGSLPILYSFDTESSSLTRTIQGEQQTYQRYDLLPTVSYPFTGLSWLTARGTALARYTYYSASLDDSDVLQEGEPIDRNYYEFRLDTRGPTFARIFNTPDNFYASRYKHVIEPQLVWSYRSRVDGFDDIPKFDGQDYIPGTNQLAFSLVNRILAKRVVNGKEQQQPTEFLTWTLSQRYFFNINASLYDRQFSTPYFSESGEPSNRSPITSRLRFRPSRSLMLSYNLEYDLDFKSFRMMRVIWSLLGDWGAVRGGWTRRNIVRRDIVRNNINASTRLTLIQGLAVNFDSSYDVSAKEYRHLRAGVVYNIQCCGFQFEFSRFNFTKFRNENLYRFGITLANVGTFGGLLGGQSRY